MRGEAQSHTTAIEADLKVLNDRKHMSEKAAHDAKAASAQLTRALARTQDQIGALPARIRPSLPDNAIDIDVDSAAKAMAAVTARLTEVKDLLETRDGARKDAAEVLGLQRALDKEASNDLDKPLNKLWVSLELWATAVAQAIGHLGNDGQWSVAEFPPERGIAELGVFATGLSGLTASLADGLTEVSVAQLVRVDTACARLSERTEALADIEGFDTAGDLTTPLLLHPLVAAKTKATTKAENQRTVERVALAQVKPAADLDFAIAAGQGCVDALDVLRRELVDAKFLGRLVALNTRALLGIASDLLGQLTDQRFGFADEFEIVSRSSASCTARTDCPEGRSS